MKTLGDWITLGWVILIVIGCGLITWWVMSTCSFFTVYYITIALNFIVMCYLGMVYGKQRK